MVKNMATCIRKIKVETVTKPVEVNTIVYSLELTEDEAKYLKQLLGSMYNLGTGRSKIMDIYWTLTDNCVPFLNDRDLVAKAKVA
jgi:hypothetical protein